MSGGTTFSHRVGLTLLLADVQLPQLDGPQSALDPAGPQAERLHNLWWHYFLTTAVVYAIVMLLLLAAIIVRRRRRGERAILGEPSLRGERIRAWWVGGGVIATTAILFVLLLDDHAVGRALRSLSTENSLKIRVTGHQWWWEVRYEDPTPSNIFTTANEIHIPVGRTVEIELQSSDVIHSFWIPNLHGKRDMIPGRPTRTVLRADRPGRYLGQCAEFCGYQHAKMRLEVVAEEEAGFQMWLEQQRKPALEPATERAKKGKDIFMRGTCVMCHTISGTPAGAMLGPDLTHIASRRKIAAGSLPNSRGHLGGWIANPQATKPGVRMPPNPLPPGELRALLDYLETLK